MRLLPAGTVQKQSGKYGTSVDHTRRFGCDEVVSWHWPEHKGIRAGVEIAAELGLSVYAAAYVALARELDAPLITADKKLARKAGRSGDIILLSETGRLSA